MKKICIILLLSFSFLFSNSLNLTKNDIIILKKIKSLTDDKMMKYTLMALAIKESSLGKYIINSKSEDYGLFQAEKYIKITGQEYGQVIIQVGIIIVNEV